MAELAVVQHGLSILSFVCRLCAPVGTWLASQFGIQRLKKMILRDSTYSRQFLRTTNSGQLITLQMFAGNCRDSTGKLKCRDFKFMGITCIPAIPVIFKTHTLISIVIFEGNLILQGYYRDSLKTSAIFDCPGGKGWDTRAGALTLYTV